MKKIVFIMLLLLPVLSGAAHITDRLLAGMYSSPDTKGEPIKLLPSGTPLDILSEKNGLVKVRLVSGKEGWVEKRFLSEDKPAKSRLLVLQSKYKQLQREFDQAKRELIKLKTAKVNNKNSGKSKESAVEKKQAHAQAEWLKLKEQLQVLQKNKSSVGGAELALKEAQVEVSLLKKQLNSVSGLKQNLSSDGVVGFSGWWFLVLVIIMLSVGFVAGLLLQDARQRKRHGGFRI